MNTPTTPIESRQPRPAPKAPKASPLTEPTTHAQTAPADPALVEELARLRAENEALKARPSHAARISLKVSEKGGLSVYGLGRFPVTLYKEQWARLLAPEQVEAIQAFLTAHDGELKAKDHA